MIYVTGDLHREVDIDKLYKIAKLDTVPNIVLIADDFGGGLVFSRSPENGIQPKQHDRRF